MPVSNLEALFNNGHVGVDLVALLDVLLHSSHFVAGELRRPKKRLLLAMPGRAEFEREEPHLLRHKER